MAFDPLKESFNSGAWAALNHVLHYINSSSDSQFERKKLYADIMNMRPWHFYPEKFFEGIEKLIDKPQT